VKSKRSPTVSKMRRLTSSSTASAVSRRASAAARCKTGNSNSRVKTEAMRASSCARGLSRPIRGRDHLAHAARQLDAAGLGEAPVAQRAHRLDDDEGIALAEIPRVVHAQLLLQDRHARLVLAQGGGPPALAKVEAHERAMDLFLERVDGKQAPGGMGGRLHASRLAVALDEPAERVDGQLAEPGALYLEPLLEGRRRDVDAVEQRTLVERHG
jgi:hypothetical protein